MTKTNDPPKLSPGIFRFGILSQLLYPDPEGRLKQEILDGLAAKKWAWHDGSMRRFEAETIRKWLYRYQTGGLPALEDRTRDYPVGEDVSQELEDALIQLRKDHPRWTFALMLENVRKTGQWNGTKPSRPTLYRWGSLKNLMRDPHPDTAARSFEYGGFGGLWMCDFLHGPRVYVGKERRKVYLHAILDDASRFVVSGRFAVSESAETLLFDLKEAVGCFGIPQRLYSDNGSAYCSHHLKQVAARLGMMLPHTPPYRPQGRGKIERFFRNVRESFLAANESRTLTDLNVAFLQWLGNYHLSVHSGIQQAPIDKRLSIPNLCRNLPPHVQIDPLFVLTRRCRFGKDGTVRIDGAVFELPEVAPGTQRAEVHYFPWDLSQVWYDHDHKPGRLLDKQANAHRFTRAKGI